MQSKRALNATRTSISSCILTSCVVAFSHTGLSSFSGWDLPHAPTQSVSNGFEWVRKSAHAWSYRIVDFFLWYSFLPSINEARAGATCAPCD